MTGSAKLVMLRGPSGSGKTTIARQLFKSAAKPMALIQQDSYRFMFTPAGGGSRANSDAIHQMIEHNARVALAAGYDVVLEGILTVRSYAQVLDRLIHAHPGPSFMFYFDISFAETVRRHATRAARTEFSAADMRSWYDQSHRSQHPLEQLIPEAYSAEQTCAFIAQQTGLASGS